MCIRDRVTTLTKKLAERLTDYYSEMGVRVKYMHSDIDTMERIDIIRGLRPVSYTHLKSSCCCTPGKEKSGSCFLLRAATRACI